MKGFSLMLENSLTPTPPIRHRLRAILIPIAFVAFIGIMAALLNSRYNRVFGLSFVTWLARYEGFHIAAHFAIFAALVFMIWGIFRSDRYKPVVWTFVLLGTLAIEVTQIMSRRQDITLAVLESSAFDLIVNMFAAMCAMLIVRAFRRNS